MKKRLFILIFILAISFIFSACNSSEISFKPSNQDKKVVMTIGGNNVEYQEFRYYVLNNKRDSYSTVENMTEQHYSELRSLAEDDAKYRHALLLMAKKYGVILSEADEKAANDFVDEYRTTYFESDEAYLLALEEQFITDYLFRELYKESDLADKVLEEMKEQGKIKTDEAAVSTALESDEIICIKEIFVNYTTNENKAVAEKRANEALNKIISGEKFEEVMEDYSNYSNNKELMEHGYYTMKYDALDVIWDTAISLAVGEYSIVVESDFGYHIIMRCEKDSEYMEKNKDEIFANYTYAKFCEEFYPFMDSLEIEYTDYGNSLNLSEIS